MADLSDPILILGPDLIRVCIIRAALFDDIEAKGLRGPVPAGQMPCPACGTGKVSYRSVEGIVSARCSTPGCAGWTE